MKITKIIGENGAMEKPCNNASCPSAILTEEGDVYIQGYVLEAAEAGAFTPPAGEGFVKMPLATLRKIAARLPA